MLCAWFAVQVRPGKEKVISRLLEYKGYEVFLPLYAAQRRWSDRLKTVQRPLFHGYTFCAIGQRINNLVVATPGVIRIVGVGREPVPIEDQEIETIRKITSSGLAARPCSFAEVGQRIFVREGPLSGVRGTILSTNGSDQLVVSIGLLQRSVAVKISRNWI